jgi:hypothetical protein
MDKHYKWWLECAECDSWIIKTQDEMVCRKAQVQHYEDTDGHIAMPSRILKR